MSFKFWPWENFPDLKTREGILAFLCEETFLQQWALEKLTKSLTTEKYTRKQRLYASDTSLGQLEQLLGSMTLFQDLDCTFLHEAQGLSPKLQETFFYLGEDYKSGLFFMIFSKKNSFWDSLPEEWVYKIEMRCPRFFETKQLFHLFSSDFNLNFEHKAELAFLERVENTPYQIYYHLGKLAESQQDLRNRTILEKDIHELISFSRFDSFALADIFSQRKFKLFFRQLDDYCDILSSAEWIPFCYFMQKHLLKIYDPSFLEAKDKLGTYDQKILKYAKIWKKEELRRSIKFFGELEHKVKTQESWLHHEFFTKILS